ncbi:hypothetical protein IAT38_007964 [Cryptococcus sp. DSM 104549]
MSSSQDDASSSSSSSSIPKSQKPFPHNHITIPSQFRSMTAGAGAGLVSSIVTCPLDVVKTRMQAQAISKGAADYESVGVIVKNIWESRGFRGFYRGLGPTLAGYLPTWGIYFTVYDLVKDRLGAWAVDTDMPIAGTSAVHIIAAMTAGATGTCMTNPLWVVKTRFMAQAGLPADQARYRHTLEAIVDIYKNEGLGAFYKGLLPSLMGVSHVAVQFPLYEKAKTWADSSNGDMSGDHKSLSPSTILVCSAFSKMVASLATYPHEVLRTRIQIRKSARPSSSTAPPPTHLATSATAPGKASLPQGLAGRPVPPPNTAPLFIPSPIIAAGIPSGIPPLSANPVPDPSPASLARSAPAPSLDLPRISAPKPPWQFWHSPKEGGVVDTFLSIKRQDGWRGFYRGLSINLVRTVPSSAVTFLTYELIMRRLSLHS